MNNQSSPEQNSEISSASTPPIEESQPVDPIPAEPTTAEQLAKVEKQMTGFEKTTLRWAKIAVLLSGLAALFVCGQWYEMHTGAGDTHALAEAAKTQAEKASGMTDAAQKIQQAADGMVAQETRIADNARDALDASNKQSKTVLNATIKASQLDQRAWLGVADFHITQFEKDKPLKASIWIANSGKTPALSVREWFSYSFLPSMSKDPNEKWFENMSFLPAQSVAPQSKYTMNPALVSGSIPGLFESIKSKSWRMFLLGRVEYKDIFGNKGATEFCLFLDDPDTLTVSYCRTHNTIQ